MRILVNKKVESFVLSESIRSTTFGSEDGMRRPHAYYVHEKCTYFFENEEEENGFYSYDFHVEKAVDDSEFGDKVRTLDMENYRDFDYVVRSLRQNGINLLNVPTYLCVDTKFTRYEDYFQMELVFIDQYCRQAKGQKIFTLDELVAHLGNEEKEYLLAQAIGDKSLLNTRYKVWIDSVPNELHGKKEVVKLKKRTLDGMMKEGVIDKADIKQAFAAFVERNDRSHEYIPLWTDGLEEYILDLPENLRKEVLVRSSQTSQNLYLFRKYCPERIIWSEVKAEEYIETDLDLMIQAGGTFHVESEWRFIESCMEKPQLELSIVDNALSFLGENFSRIASKLHKCTTTDILRSVAKSLETEALESSVLSKVPTKLLGLEYAHLKRADYTTWKLLEKRYRSVDMVALALKVGLIAGVSEEELVDMLLTEQASMHFSLTDWYLDRVYQKLNFAPGLAWVKAEAARYEEQMAKKRTESNEQVVKLVQNSNLLAVRVSAKDAYSRADGYSIYKDGDLVGNLQPDEIRVLLIEGRRNAYLIDVERVKKLRNGVLHLDILKEDAGFVIGSKGCKIKEITKRLNELGCQIKTINVHT